MRLGCSNMLSNIVKKTFNELSNQEIYQILDLRNKVFIMEQAILYVDTDFRDQKSVHYMIFDGEKLVSYLRLIPPGVKFQNEHALSRVVTDPEYRSQKLASKIIKEAMNLFHGK